MDSIIVVCGAIIEITTAIGLLVTFITWLSRIIEGQRCQLRTAILHTYYTCKDDKKIRQYEAENLVKNYHAYKALKGNSFIDQIYDEYKKWEITT